MWVVTVHFCRLIELDINQFRKEISLPDLAVPLTHELLTSPDLCCYLLVLRHAVGSQLIERIKERLSILSREMAKVLLSSGCNLNQFIVDVSGGDDTNMWGISIFSIPFWL